MAITKITKTELLELTSTTGAVRLPSGTTAERPSTNLNAGDFRFNTDDNKVEYYDGSSWFQIDDESEPPIPSENFNTVLWAGNGGTQSITGVGFQPDLVWVKRRSAAEDHVLFDSVRGVQEQLRSNSQGVQSTKTNALSSFDSDGFTTGANNALNTTGQTYVGWSFKAGGAAVSNSNGSISSSVSANTKSGFSIVSYTGNGAAGATVGHGLTAAPNLVITKGTTGSAGNTNWNVYSSTLGATKKLMLNSSDGENTNTTWWNDTAPTSTVFSLGTTGDSNYNSSNYIAYCFHDVTGYQKIGSYTGNSSANGPVVETGFEPAFLLIKRTNTSGDNWVLYDNKRDLVNARYKYLSPNNTDAEGSDDLSNYPIINFLTNGFQIAGTDSRVNTNGSSYTYLAIAADAGTTTPTLANSFKTNLYTGNGSVLTVGGHLNGGAQFNGSNSLIDITGFSNFASTGVSISAWINVSSFSSGPTILNLYSNNSIVFGTNSSGQFFRSGQGTTVTSAATMSTGTWHHVVMTANTSADTTLYLDGFIAGSGNSTTAMYNSNSDKDLIGAYGTNSQPMDGSIDQVRIYNSVLTASQVSELYNETSSTANTLNFPAGAGCIAAYPLNSNSNDLSGNYNGTDSNITYSEGPGFMPSLVWLKGRGAGPSGSGNPVLFDSVRGLVAPSYLASNLTNGEFGNTNTGVLSLHKDGYTVSDDANGGGNVNGASGGLYTNGTYVGWSWKGAVNLPTINTDGSITSIVSANPAAGFSIVRWTGTQTNDSIGHGLSSAPEVIILKDASNTYNWYVYSKPSGASNNLRFEGLNTTSAATTENSQFTTTSSLIENLTTFASLNTSGAIMIAYCFHSVSNHCKVGFYTGNGTSQILYTTDDGTSGGNNPFQPSYVLVKRYDSGSAGNWVINSLVTGAGYELYADLSNQENYDANGIQSFNSNGFTVGSGYNFNASSGTYIYLAIK